MKRNTTKEGMTQTINLAEIEGDGAFPCPKCGTIISPEDETEKVYKIIDTKIINDELVELVIVCENCRTQVKLIGFQQTI